MSPTYALYVRSILDDDSPLQAPRQAPRHALELHVVTWPSDGGSMAWLALGEGEFLWFVQVSCVASRARHDAAAAARSRGLS
jgi:hypothetical protein